MFNEVYRGRRVLLTGHTGFKGSWLATWLLELGAEVTGLAIEPPSDPALFEVLGLADRMDDRRVDVRDADGVRAVVDGVRPEFVFHLAAQALVRRSYADPAETFATNVLGTVHLCDALRRAARPCTAVLITSDKCYENVEQEAGYVEDDRLGGKDPYSASKGAAELVIHAFHHSYFSEPDPVRFASARAGNVIGGGDWAADRLVPDCVRAWSRDEPVELRRPRSTRPWQHVLEPLGGYLHLGQQLRARPELQGRAYNFGPPPDADFTVLELLEALAGHWDFGDGAERLVVNEDSGFHEAGLLKLDCSRARDELGWGPALDFARTAAMTADWYRRHHEGGTDMAAFTREQIAAYVEGWRLSA